MIKTRQNSKNCIMTVLKMALGERIPKGDSLISEKISQNAIALEKAAWSATASDVDHSESDVFPVYITVIAKFIVHISPAFYTGRHSFTFRDMLLNNELLDLRDDIVNIDVNELWPEIYNNYLFSEDEFKQVIFTRNVEVSIAIKGLTELIESCCGSNVCSEAETLKTLKQQRIFEEGTAFAEAKQKVCFAKGEGVWYQGSNKIVLPCSDEDAICPVIPEEASKVYSEIENINYFTTCMRYEDFLMSYSIDEYHEQVLGQVTDSDQVYQIMERYMKEIKMIQVYLDQL